MQVRAVQGNSAPACDTQVLLGESAHWLAKVNLHCNVHLGLES